MDNKTNEIATFEIKDEENRSARSPRIVVVGNAEYSHARVDTKHENK